jgi:sulfate permease, SulP family
VFTFGLPLVAWCPKPVVAGILVMLAWSLVDPWSLGLLRRDGAPAGAATDPGSVTDRRLSLAVVAAVGVVTVASGFVAGVALGVLLSFVILVRALNRSLVRQRFSAVAMPSRRVYAPAHESELAAARPGIAVLELEGALFFGSVERLELEVEALVRESAGAAPLTTLVLDLRRVSTVDASGAVMLGRLRETLAVRGVLLRLAGVTPDNRHGESLRAHGMLGSADTWALHEDTDRAIEAAEQAALARAGLPPTGTPVALAQCALLAGLDAAAFERVQALLPERRLAAGERLFAQGEAGDAIYVLCAGSVSVLDLARRQRFVSFSPGMTFGELAVLDGGDRTADAVADEPSIVRSLPADVMRQLEREAPGIAALLYRNLARHLATRLREASGAWRRAAG